MVINKSILIIFLISVLVIVGCEEKNNQLANPASTNCIDQGYTLEMRENEQGQYGVCIFPDGSECEEWAFMRGECTPEQNTEDKYSCNLDEDCVPASCCHPDSCVNKDYKPECEGFMCTMECEPGTLDCQQGSCQCINNQCEAVFNE